MPTQSVDQHNVSSRTHPVASRLDACRPCAVVAAVTLVVLAVMMAHTSRSVAARPAAGDGARQVGFAALEGPEPRPPDVAEIHQVARECDDEQAHPSWIFCDDFETDAPLVGPGRYFEYGDDDGDFVPLDGIGVQGSRAMRALWQAGEVGAGGLKLGFGRVANRYIGRAQIRPDDDFREIYYRMYLRNQPGWRGDPAKLSRATIFTSASDWSQAMIAHLWGDGDEHLLIDPVRCVGQDDRPKCVGYNDFGNMDWLGYRPGVTPLFATDHSDRWYCIEARVRLNDPGSDNGVQAFWIDGQLEAQRDDLNFVGSYTEYGLNAVFFENYWNDGSPREQARYFDNIVVSTERIGCVSEPTVPTATSTPGPTSSPSPQATSTDGAPSPTAVATREGTATSTRVTPVSTAAATSSPTSTPAAPAGDALLIPLAQR